MEETIDVVCVFVPYNRSSNFVYVSLSTSSRNQQFLCCILSSLALCSDIRVADLAPGRQRFSSLRAFQIPARKGGSEFKKKKSCWGCVIMFNRGFTVTSQGNLANVKSNWLVSGKIQA